MAPLKRELVVGTLDLPAGLKRIWVDRTAVSRDRSSARVSRALVVWFNGALYSCVEFEAHGPTKLAYKPHAPLSSGVTGARITLWLETHAAATLLGMNSPT